MSMIIPLEYEYKVFQAVKEWFFSKWENDKELYHFLTEENKEILSKLKNENIGERQLLFKSESKEMAELFNSILRELIYPDPFLARTFLHNSTLPEDLHIRKWLRDNYLPKEAVDILFDDNLFSKDWLIDSDFAKSQSLKGIPLRCFWVGEILKDFASDYEHYRLIDLVKESGIKESIEELRKNRIYESNEGKVYDYSPISKLTKMKDGYIQEVFTEKDFDNSKDCLNQADNILCLYIQKGQNDCRKDEFFGDTLNDSRYKFILRYKDKEKTIPFQLLPKYKNFINSLSNKYTLTGLYETVDKLEEKQEASLGLYNGAITWNKDKGSATGWLENIVKWQLGDVLDKHSRIDSRTGKRILKEKLESSGGRLDDPETKDKHGIPLKDTIKSETLSPENSYEINEETNENKKFLLEIYRVKPEMKDIIEKESRGEALTSKERKIKERTIKKFQKN